MIKWITDYWPLYIAAAAALVVIIFSIYTFIKKPRKEQLEKIKEWLLYAVAIAEKEFGGGTGQIKLRYVYDKFLSTFPAFASIIPFELFSQLVDEALIKFKEILKNNDKIQEYIEDKVGIVNKNE